MSPRPSSRTGILSILLAIRSVWAVRLSSGESKIFILASPECNWAFTSLNGLGGPLELLLLLSAYCGGGWPLLLLHCCCGALGGCLAPWRVVAGGSARSAARSWCQSSSLGASLSWTAAPSGIVPAPQELAAGSFIPSPDLALACLAPRQACFLWGLVRVPGAREGVQSWTG